MRAAWALPIAFAIPALVSSAAPSSCPRQNCASNTDDGRSDVANFLPRPTSRNRQTQPSSNGWTQKRYSPLPATGFVASPALTSVKAAVMPRRGREATAACSRVGSREGRGSRVWFGRSQIGRRQRPWGGRHDSAVVLGSGSGQTEFYSW